MASVDGPTEVHKVTVAKEVLRHRKPANGPFPSPHLPPRIEAARKKYAAFITRELEHYIANA